MLTWIYVISLTHNCFLVPVGNSVTIIGKWYDDWDVTVLYCFRLISKPSFFTNWCKLSRPILTDGKRKGFISSHNFLDPISGIRLWVFLISDVIKSERFIYICLITAYQAWGESPNHQHIKPIPNKGLWQLNFSIAWGRTLFRRNIQRFFGDIQHS